MILEATRGETWLQWVLKVRLRLQRDVKGKKREECSIHFLQVSQWILQRIGGWGALTYCLNIFKLYKIIPAWIPAEDLRIIKKNFSETNHALFINLIHKFSDKPFFKTLFNQDKTICSRKSDVFVLFYYLEPSHDWSLHGTKRWSCAQWVYPRRQCVNTARNPRKISVFNAAKGTSTILGIALSLVYTGWTAWMKSSHL